MDKQIYYNDEFVKGAILEIVRQIYTANYRPDYIVGLKRGGLVPGVMLSHYLDIPLHTLDPEESNLWMAEDAFGNPHHEVDFYEGDPMSLFENDTAKQILIVDDINDTGATINLILQDWPSGCFPKDPEWDNIWNSNVRFATVFDNLASKAEVPMDYVGEEINKAENPIWIEFPFEEWWTK